MTRLTARFMIFILALTGLTNGYSTDEVEATLAKAEVPAQVSAFSTSQTALPPSLWSEKTTETPEEPIVKVIFEEGSVQEEIAAPEADAVLYSDAIPLTYEEQSALQDACEEFSVPYALALALIEQETNFRNITGDGGHSYGYMQIQPRWHQTRMTNLGVTDLMDPAGNFRVGLDLLSDQYDIYGDWGMALTVYNMGHYPGYVSNYGYSVLSKYENWLGIVGDVK